MRRHTAEVALGEGLGQPAVRCLGRAGEADCKDKQRPSEGHRLHGWLGDEGGSLEPKAAPKVAQREGLSGEAGGGSAAARAGGRQTVELRTVSGFLNVLRWVVQIYILASKMLVF